MFESVTPGKMYIEVPTHSDRFEVVGMWSGYTASQSRIVHREYIKDKKLAEAINSLGRIYYTDGTALVLSVRQMKYRERKQKDILGYKRLIRDCIRKNTCNVEDL